MSDYVMTLNSDSEEQTTPDDTHLDTGFMFDILSSSHADMVDQMKGLDGSDKKNSNIESVSVIDIIARRRLNKKRKRSDNNAIEDDGDPATFSQISTDDEDKISTALTEAGIPLDKLDDDDETYSTSSRDESDSETQVEKDRKAAFFDSDAPTELHTSFLSMNLSRPILKAITSLGFQKPTPIQAATIPVALLGKDIVGGAVTGSGKTAAFVIPILERLLYREKGKNATASRCVILVPTRELAIQCHEVGTKLAAHTDIRLCLIVGGLSIKSQEAVLRTRPDLIIATPGRLIDHLHNSPSFSLDALDILVLDEADRMLSDGFSDELTEIVKSCPVSRQTMLFSATMTDSVGELVRMSLKKPVRLFVDPKRSMARSLIQEFVRVRTGREAERPALLVTLCKKSFKSRVIIFFRSKKLAHQMRVVFSLLEMKCEELHGDLSQEQRLKALEHFRDGSADFLMATDLAARGLDIKGVETVINYDMPGQLAQYLHRVGRTARAGNAGRSVTLVGETDRKMLKATLKYGMGNDQVRHRTLSVEAVSRWMDRLQELKNDISAVLQEEKEEKQLRKAEMEIKKGENLIEHRAEIYSRPARTWFQTGKEKADAASISKQQYENGFNFHEGGKPLEGTKPKRHKLAGLSRKAKRRKLIMEEDASIGDKKALNASIRSAKRSARPSKIGSIAKMVQRIEPKPKFKSHYKGTFDRDPESKDARAQVKKLKTSRVANSSSKT